ncbi:hypothetical protein BJF83_24785 [Nocardiopsis sp. CNR-923]|uniref:hypothetical protein n=1 Tax=Nocardiopsis sp. CNR-923 TaxID=1904965 RepID=UPI000964608D|nr:hypothetical protein [Nocardiopsis sp. CNR-923]OLT30472.1 hypothetical protein BJF83_24785 [Nocardiopsis sp. CNR-923]
MDQYEAQIQRIKARYPPSLERLARISLVRQRQHRAEQQVAQQAQAARVARQLQFRANRPRVTR